MKKTMIALAMALYASPSFAEDLNFTIPKNYASVLHMDQGGIRIDEYTPRGQTAVNWRRMITVNRTAGRKQPPQKVLSNFTTSLGKLCPSRTVNALPGPGVSARIDCTTMTDVDRQTIFARVIQSRLNTYLLLISFRNEKVDEAEASIARAALASATVSAGSPAVLRTQ